MFYRIARQCSRVLSENKQITGSGQFTTSFTYNSADLPVTMTYPDDEVVTFAYNNNMLPTSVTGADTYAQTIAYDSAMRTPALAPGASVIQLVRGANKINSMFTYNPWNVDGSRDMGWLLVYCLLMVFYPIDFHCLRPRPACNLTLYMVEHIISCSVLMRVLLKSPLRWFRTPEFAQGLSGNRQSYRNGGWELLQKYERN